MNIASFYDEIVPPVRTSLLPVTIKKFTPCSRSYEESLDRVLWLSCRHNLPVEPGMPKVKRPHLPTAAEKMGWKSNPYVDWLTDGSPTPDTRCIMKGLFGNWGFRAPGSKNPNYESLMTPRYHEALERRDALCAIHGYVLPPL